MTDKVDDLLDRVREQAFGTHPGRLPAQLHAALRTAADDRTRARVAAGLARCWVYGGEATRAHEFADAAVDAAERTGDPELIADAVEAALLARWGPDDLDVRRDLTARLSDVTSYLTDHGPRMQAALWQLTVALERLDGIALARQLAVLDSLAAETNTPDVRFFADSRRAMAALLADDVALARSKSTSALAAAEAAGLADLEAVKHCLTAALALHTTDVPTLTTEAQLHVEHGLTMGVAGIAVGGARLYCAAGKFDDARHVLDRVDVYALPRDVDWLPTVALAVVAGVDCGAIDLVRSCLDRLRPYAGRAVVDAGAIAFHGVVSDVLYRACTALELAEAESWRARAIEEYRRLGCRWWLDRLGESSPPSSRLAHFRPTGADLWLVGFDGTSQVTRDVKGLHYIRELIKFRGEDIAALELVARFESTPGAVVDTDAGPLLDAQAKAAYRRRLADLDEAIEETSNYARLSRLEAERDALIDELARATGLGGRDRLAGSNSERARIAVRKAISSAIDRIAKQDSGFAHVLCSAISTGRLCRYEPDPTRPLDWQL